MGKAFLEGALRGIALVCTATLVATMVGLAGEAANKISPETPAQPAKS